MLTPCLQLARRQLTSDSQSIDVSPSPQSPAGANITFPTCTANITGAAYTPFDAVSPQDKVPSECWLR